MNDHRTDPGKNDPDSLVFRVGDISIALTSENGDGEILLPQKYVPFSTRSEPDLKIQVHRQRNISEVGDCRIRSANDYWALGLWGDKRVIQRFSKGSITHLLALQPDLRSGEVFWAQETSKKRAPDSFALQYPLDTLLYILLLAQGRGALCHAAAVSHQGRGYVFAGFSGAGKSTMARIWHQSRGVTVLNDDRAILRRRQNNCGLYGTPWYSGDIPSSPQATSLEKIFFIKHSPKNQATLMAPVDAASRLLNSSFSSIWSPSDLAFTLDFLEEIVRVVPCYELGFKPDESVVDFIECL